MRLPNWIREETRKSRGGHDVRTLLRSGHLHTVCEEARCPNMGRCFTRLRATFLILGSACTRNCGFCAVGHGTPQRADPEEPRRVAEAAADLELEYVVVTSVTRDDLADGGAEHFAATIAALRSRIPGVRVEVLVPDFRGSAESIRTVLSAEPDVFNHNVETVPRLYATVRPGAVYERSLAVLERARTGGRAPIKSGLMVGLGETLDEVKKVMADLRRVGCELLTVGQYLRPGRNHLPVQRFVTPEEFETYRIMGETLGFRKVASGPLVRSSMDAKEMSHA